LVSLKLKRVLDLS